MSLLSIFKRHAEPVSLDVGADAVQRARTRARQRLIGAVVLVGIGVVGFPLVFETQPRSIPVDIPIELPRKEAAAPLAMPAGRTPAAAAIASGVRAAPPAEPSPAAPNEVITESRADAGRDVTLPVASAVSTPASNPIAKAPVATPAETPTSKKAAGEPKPGVPATEGARAKALLEGKPAADREASGRFVVQVGAFADAGAARETRLKVEKLGLKTYTQVASTAAGNRIRVRVGPFGTRDEADKALAKARSAGLTAVVLTL